MPKLKPLTLTPDERQSLDAWVRRPKTAQRLALRSRIVLAAAEGKSNSEIAGACKVALPTVGKWRQRFLENRLDGLTARSNTLVPQATSINRGRRRDRPVKNWPGARGGAEALR